MALRVVVADDNDEFRRAVGDELAADPGLLVVASVTTGAETLLAAAEHRPDVVLLDLEMPGGGAGLAAELARLHPRTRLACLTARDDETSVLRMLAAGATAYIAKGALGVDLATCVRHCGEGTLFVLAACADDVRRRIGTLAGPTVAPG